MKHLAKPYIDLTPVLRKSACVAGGFWSKMDFEELKKAQRKVNALFLVRFSLLRFVYFDSYVKIMKLMLGRREC